MSGEVKIVLPKLGESIVSATVVQWFKQVGDPVALDEPLLEVSTDKVNSEIPSPVAGIVQQILVQPNEELQVGEPLAIVRVQEVHTTPAEQTQSYILLSSFRCAISFCPPSFAREGHCFRKHRSDSTYRSRRTPDEKRY